MWTNLGFFSWLLLLCVRYVLKRLSPVSFRVEECNTQKVSQSSWPTHPKLALEGGEKPEVCVYSGEISDKSLSLFHTIPKLFVRQNESGVTLSSLNIIDHYPWYFHRFNGVSFFEHFR